MRRFLVLAVLILPFAAPYAHAANPGIDSISPAVLASSPSPQTVTITGHDFNPGATVTLIYRTSPFGFARRVEDLTGTPITHDVTVVSSTKITMTVQYQPTATLDLIVSISNPAPDTTPAQSPLTITAAFSDATPIIFTIDYNPDFDETTMTVQARVTPHSTGYLVFGGQVPHAFFGLIIEGATSASDDDGDGVVTFKPFPADPGFAVFFVIDSTGVKHSASARWSIPVPDVSVLLHDVSIELGADGSMSRIVENGAAFPLVLWVRPGVGAWYADMADGGTDDADIQKIQNGHVNLLTSSFHSLGASPSQPGSFQPSDHIVIIDSDRTAWWSSVLPSPLTGTPGNGTIFASTPSSLEGTPALLYIERRGGAEGTVSVDYRTSNDTALADVNYVPASGTVTFARGEFLKTVSIQTKRDGIYAPSLFYNVELTPHGTSLATANPLHVLVGNADAPPALSIGDVRTTEGDSGLRTVTVPVTLEGLTALPATVDWSASDGTGGRLQFAVGEKLKTIAITYLANTDPGPDRTIKLTLAFPDSATIAKGAGTVTIVDDDTQTLSVNDIQAEEQTQTATFLVTMSRAVLTPVTVHYATFDGTATAPLDYTSTSGILTFAPGEIAKTITVPVAQDQIADGGETFTLRLSGASGATITRNTGTATIMESDRLPQPVVLIDDVAIAEGNSGTADATFNVRLSFASTLPVVVAWKTENGSAHDDSDYSAGIGTLTFAPGETALPVTVKISGDTTPEANETFRLIVIGASNAVAGNGASCTIVDDDSVVVPPRHRSVGH